MAISIKQKIVLAALIFYATFAWVQAAHAAGLTKPANNLGLVGYWSFNEGTSTVATDFSGNGNTGTLTGSTLPTWIEGRLGKGLGFDGSNAYVDLGAPSSISLADTITVSAWVKTSTLSLNDFRDIISSASSGTTANYQLELNRTAGRASVIWGNSVILTGDTSLTANTWTHIVMVRSGSTGDWTATLYINGINDGSVGSAVNPSGGASAQTTIGKFSQAATRYFSGSIDEVRIFSRALTATEVAALYNSGASKFGSSFALGQGALTNGLVGHWTMDGADTLTSITDRSGQGNNGYFVGGATSTAKVAGKLGQALQFGGSTKVTIADTDSLDPSTVTISAWVYSTGGDPSATSERIVDKANSGTINQGGYRLQAFNSSNCGGSAKWGMQWYNGSAQLLCGPTITSTTGVWTHITFTHDGTTGRMYANGALVDSLIAAYTTGNSFNLGLGNSNQVDRSLTGKMDDVRIYNRALSAEEIKQLYGLGGLKANASSQSLSAGTTLNTGLAGYWSFNGPDITDSAVVDRSGLANNGHFVGVATSSAKAAGKMGQGITLDGADDQVLVPDDASLDPGTSDFAISLWAKSSNMEGGDSLMLKTNGGGESSTYGFHYGTFGTRQPTMHMSSGAAFTQIQSASFLSLGEWNHIVITVDRDTMANTKVYINGVVTTTNVTNPTSNTGSISNSVPLSIGAESDGGFLWQGEMDEVRYYTRTLSEEEVKQLYLLGK